MKKRDKRLTAADIAETALFVALMIAGVYIRIPIPVMPLTFQTVFAVLAGLLLGSKKGMIAMIVYAVLGLIGLPVFSDGGGFYYVIKPSFGYIIGFILTAGVAGIGYYRSKKLWLIIVLALAATLADYVVGILYFIVVWELSGNPALWHSVVAYNLVYLPKDILLALPAALISRVVAPKVVAVHGRAKREGNGEQTP